MTNHELNSLQQAGAFVVSYDFKDHMKNICVFASSSDAVDKKYFDAARALGAEIGRRGMTLIYGGARVGLMGALAQAVKQTGGCVIGVVPKMIADKGLVYADADEIIITAGLRERKAEMELRADAFIALPGGFGTLEEIAEIVTLKQLQLHQKPIIFLNTDGFYDSLFSFFVKFYEERFAKKTDVFYQSADPRAIFEYLESYHPPVIPEKWF